MTARSPRLAKLGAELRRRRRDQDLTLTALARRLTSLGHPISIGWISLVERGERAAAADLLAVWRKELGWLEDLPAEYDDRPALREGLVPYLGAFLSVSTELPLGRAAELLEVSVGDVRLALRELEQGLAVYGIRVLDDGFSARLAPTPGLAKACEPLAQRRPSERLTEAQAEVLAIVVREGACLRSVVENERGVDCGELLTKLVRRGYLTAEEDETMPGRPLWYRVGEHALQVFEVSTIEELRHAMMPDPNTEEQLG